MKKLCRESKPKKELPVVVTNTLHPTNKKFKRGDTILAIIDLRIEKGPFQILYRINNKDTEQLKDYKNSLLRIPLTLEEGSNVIEVLIEDSNGNTLIANKEIKAS